MEDEILLKECEYCNTLHEGKYGSGRFCCNKCARRFSSSVNREKTNKKVSETLKRISDEDPNFGFKNPERRRIARKSYLENYKPKKPDQYENLSTATATMPPRASMPTAT